MAYGGTREAWLIDLNSETLFAFRQPSLKEYLDVRPYRRGDSVSPEAFPDVQFTIDAILG